MAHYCFKCQKEVSVLSAVQVGRRDCCPACNADLHCCRNCRHYDVRAYNQCNENQAERVLEKDESNFCDYFEYREGRSDLLPPKDKAAIIKDLDALFK